MGFRMVNKLSYIDYEKNLSIFSIRGRPLPKKSKKKYFLKEWKILLHSKAHVKFSRFVLFSKILYGLLG
jgi:hypothetical protein